MSDNWSAIALVGVGLFLLGGVFSFYKQGLKLWSAVLLAGAVMSIWAGVLRW
ncbi:hypothetical protein [Rhizohabitans arisaemae]|uniref:hypothetical protein n=1 Tax=Rhizohabitans arisaemae TaxID=2720610 RepID=UPI0024B1A256|nr:hypothetical protein [Rhizohabitans arisaemae]